MIDANFDLDVEAKLLGFIIVIADFMCMPDNSIFYLPFPLALN